MSELRSQLPTTPTRGRTVRATRTSPSATWSRASASWPTVSAGQRPATAPPHRHRHRAAALLHQGSPLQIIETALPQASPATCCRRCPPARMTSATRRPGFGSPSCSPTTRAGRGRATGCVGMATAMVLAWRWESSWWNRPRRRLPRLRPGGKPVSLLTHYHSLSAAPDRSPVVPERARAALSCAALDPGGGWRERADPTCAAGPPSAGARLAMCTDGVWAVWPRTRSALRSRPRPKPGQSAAVGRHRDPLGQQGQRHRPGVDVLVTMAADARRQALVISDRPWFV